jgi:hypothetical protein
MRVTRQDGVALGTAAVYLYVGFLVLANHQWDWRDFIRIGEDSVLRSNRSTAIRLDPDYSYYRAPQRGYDGQTIYFIALDPLQARHYLDSPSYRYSRILYPLLARSIAFGYQDLIPFALVLINFVALIVSGWLLASMLSHNHWYALLFTLYVGQMYSFTRDLTEPLAYALVLGAIYLLRRERFRTAAVLFGLAILTRETAAIFPLVYGAWFWKERQRATAVWMLAALVPAALWQGVLYWWLGEIAYVAVPALTVMPLGGIIALFPLDGIESLTLLLVAVPAMLMTGAAVAMLARGSFSAEALLLLVNGWCFAIHASGSSLADLQAASRVMTPVVLAAMLALPVFASRITQTPFRFSAVLWSCGALGYVIKETFINIAA